MEGNGEGVTAEGDTAGPGADGAAEGLVTAPVDEAAPIDETTEVEFEPLTAHKGVVLPTFDTTQEEASSVKSSK